MNPEIKTIVADKNILKDMHVHTRFCDGSGTPDEIVQAAIAKGIDVIGFSGHGHMSFDEEVCMSIAGTEEYEKAVREAADKYADKIRVLCGVEQDYYSDQTPERWDYVIGSAHYVEIPLADFTEAKGAGSELAEIAANCEVSGAFAYPAVDDTPEKFEYAIEKFFGGDVYAFAEKYFEVEADVVRKTGADIIGHFDLISKFNAGGEFGGKGKYFDESHPRYIAAWQKAADALLETGALFEINYGGINRKRRTEPYPSKPIREYLEARGAKFINSSDSHTPDTLACWLDRSR